MNLTSPTFSNLEPFPLKYTKDGEGISPPLQWSDVPRQTRELALIFEMTTTRTNEPPFAQWVIYNIPPEWDELPEGITHQRQPEKAPVTRQGTNSLENVGYDGPQGVISRSVNLRFRLFALDVPLDLPEGASRDDLLRAMEGHVIDQAELKTFYQRPKT